LTFTIARFARFDPAWIARATSSFPVPVSPVISTVESVAATSPTRSSTSRSVGEAPRMPPAAVAVAAISSRSATFSSSSCDRSFWISSNASAFATAVVTGRATSSRIAASSGVKGNGLVRATTRAATNSLPIVRGTITAHSAPASFIPAPPRRVSVPMWSTTSVRRSRSMASRKNGVCGQEAPVAPYVSENRRT
jgi:hypothetical protein